MDSENFTSTDELTNISHSHEANDNLILCGWISVKDRLPDDYEEVLYFSINDFDQKEIMTGHRANGEWTHCCCFYSTRVLSDLVRVTHWMKLPDKPKENSL